MRKYGQGWFNESRRHSLARMGVKTGRKVNYTKTHFIAGGNFKETIVKRGEHTHVVKISSPTGEEWYNVYRVGGFLVPRHQIEGGLTKKESEKIFRNAEKFYGEPVNYQREPLLGIKQHPKFVGNAPLPDQDHDGVPDKFDWDKDGDGVPNWEDDEGVFEYVPREFSGSLAVFPDKTRDSDFDGVPDYKDPYPNNPTKVDYAKKPKLLFTDKSGNKLYMKFIKTRGRFQIYGKNKEGKIVSPSGVNTLMKRAGLKIQPVTKKGIQLRGINFTKKPIARMR